MSNLAKWFPFKFKRRKAGDAPAETEKAGPPAVVDPFFQTPMSALLRSFLSEPFLRGELRSAEMERFFGDFSPTRFSPNVDVVDEESHLRVTAELPGMDKDDVQVTVDDHGLTIRGEKRHEHETKEDGCYRTERAFGAFLRVVPLPRDIDRESFEAKFDKGVLTVRVAKKAQPEPEHRTIEIAG